MADQLQTGAAGGAARAPSPSPAYGVLFYLFAGRARPVILEFDPTMTYQNNSSGGTDNTKRSSSPHLAQFGQCTTAAADGSSSSNQQKQKKNTFVYINGRKVSERDIIRFTNSTPKLPILKAPANAQLSLGGGGGNTASAVASASGPSSSAAAIVADETMKALHRVILIDVIRRSSYDPTDNNTKQMLMSEAEREAQDEQLEALLRALNGEAEDDDDAEEDADDGVPVKTAAVDSSGLNNDSPAVPPAAAADEGKEEEYADDTVPEDEQQGITAVSDAAPPTTAATSSTAKQNDEQRKQQRKIRLNPNDLVLDDDMRAMMKGKDITILAMVPSRDCRARAHSTAASQRRVNPHKLSGGGSTASPLTPSTSTVKFQDDRQRSSTTTQRNGRGILLAGSSASVRPQSAGAGAAKVNTFGASASVYGANGAVADKQSQPFAVPAYMGSLRRVVVSSSKRILKGGSKAYKHAGSASLNDSMATSLNGTLNNVSSIANMLAGQEEDHGAATAASPQQEEIRIVGGAEYVVNKDGSLTAASAAAKKRVQIQSGSNKQKGGGVRQQFGNDSGVFSATNALIDPSNPNLMLCDSLESLLRQLSPFCFSSLDEVDFRIKPSAAKGQDADIVAFAGLNALHDAADNDAEEEGDAADGSNKKKRHGVLNVASEATKYTIPPCMLFGRGRDGDRNGSHAHDAINDDDLDPEAVTVRGYPLLMSQNDAFGLYNFISYSERMLPREERWAREKAIAAKKASTKRMADLVLKSQQFDTASSWRNNDAHGSRKGFFREDNFAPLHPRLFAASEVVAGSLSKAASNGPSSVRGAAGVPSHERRVVFSASDWFNVRPICPLQLHMEWLSGTRLWVPTTTTRTRAATTKRLPHQAATVPILAEQLLAPQQAAEAAYYAAVYDETAIDRPMAPIMHPPPPLSFRRIGESSGGGNRRRGGQGGNATTTAGTDLTGVGQLSIDNVNTYIAGGVSSSKIITAMSPLRRKGQLSLLSDATRGNPYYTGTGPGVLLSRKKIAAAHAAYAAAEAAKKNALEDAKAKAEIAVAPAAGGADATSAVNAPPTAAVASSVAPSPRPAVAVTDLAAAPSAPVTTSAVPTTTVSAVISPRPPTTTVPGSTPPPAPPAAAISTVVSPRPTVHIVTPATAATPPIAPAAAVAAAPVPPLQIAQLGQSAAATGSATQSIAATGRSVVVVPPCAPVVTTSSARPQTAPNTTSVKNPTVTQPHQQQQQSQVSSSHPLLKLLLAQRIQDHMDYLATQEEAYRRQTLWRKQLEARRVMLLSFVKEGDEISATATELEAVLFYKKRAHDATMAMNGTAAAAGTVSGGGVAPASFPFIQYSLGNNHTPKVKRALVEPSPLVRKLRGMLGSPAPLPAQ